MQTSNCDRPGTSRSFELLHPEIQRWIWEQGWTELRDAQERTIPFVLEARRELLISSSTASGKTEAVFLPILSRMLSGQSRNRCAIYISPLKALINDQWNRLEALCAQLEIPVIPWHGDISTARKVRFMKNPDGIVLITPESLESLLVHKRSDLPRLFEACEFVVIDEVHSYIGSERGQQLQSILHRLESVLDRKLLRLGLSATLGDQPIASEFLRPGDGHEITVIQAREGSRRLDARIEGLIDAEGLDEEAIKTFPSELRRGSGPEIIDELVSDLRGTNNLVFPNSRAQVEYYADGLRKKCEELGVPNEFLPHHGSLSKEIREETEEALKRKERPATAICTTTLELGIDIGSVEKVVQIGCGPSVASVRQRLGRSGRRTGTASILRCFCVEPALTPNATISVRLREDLVQTLAMLRLLRRNWCEPPTAKGLHLSTLIHQIMALIAQEGGARALNVYSLLCSSGPFRNVSQQDFVGVLRSMGAKDLITQDPTGLLLLGPTGERLVGSRRFYAVFTTKKDFKLFADGKALGTLPIGTPLKTGSFVIFAGRRWEVAAVDDRCRTIDVIPSEGGLVPIFSGSGVAVHKVVRQEMFRVLCERDTPEDTDLTCRFLLEEARTEFARLNLAQERLVQSGRNLLLFPWDGDSTLNTLCLMFESLGLKAENQGICLCLSGAERNEALEAIGTLLRPNFVTEHGLARRILNLRCDKWDWVLSEDLLGKNYVSLHLDLAQAFECLQNLAK